MKQNAIIKNLQKKSTMEVWDKYCKSKDNLLARDVQRLYHTTSAFNLALYDITKKWFDENIINDGYGLKTNQTGLNFQGYQRLIAMTL